MVLSCVCRRGGGGRGGGGGQGCGEAGQRGPTATGGIGDNRPLCMTTRFKSRSVKLFW